MNKKNTWGYRFFMINVTDSEAKICFNCMHKWRLSCTLTDDLIEDWCTCPMFRKDKIIKGSV